MKKGRKLYALFILIQSLVYGFGNPVTKIAFQSITPLWLLAVRFTIAFAAFMLFYGKRVVQAVRSVDMRVWLPSGLCCAGAYISCNVALSLTSATNVGFIMSLPVLFAPILHSVVLHKKYQLKKLPLQIATIVGLLLLCCNGGFFSIGAGEILALADALCIAGHLVFSERAFEKMDVMPLTALQISVTMIISIAGALVFDDISVLSAVKPSAWLVAVYLALVCSIAAYLLQNTAVRHLSSGTVSMLQCTQPILTAVIAFLLLGERLSGLGLLGGFIITACIVLDGWLSAKYEQ